MGSWNYKIVHDYNATQLIKEFSEEDLELKNSKGMDNEDLDFIIYAEKDDSVINTGRVLLIKMSDMMVKDFVKYKNTEDIALSWSKAIYQQQNLKNNKTFQFTEKEIAKAFLKSIELQAPNLVGISSLDIQNFTQNIIESLSSFLHKELKFSREQWDPTLKSEKYLFAKPENAINFFVGKCNEIISRLQEIKEKLLLVKQLLEVSRVENLSIKIIDFYISNFQNLKKWLINNRNEIKIKIPYICGVWSGTVEFVMGMVDILLLLLHIVLIDILDDDIRLERLEIREGIEELLSAFLSSPVKFVEQIIQSIKDYKYTRYDDPSLNIYQKQYNEGEDTVIAIDIVVTVITMVRAIPALAKKLPKFTKWIDEVLERNPKLIKAIDEFPERKLLDDVENDIRKLDEFADGRKRKYGDNTAFSNYAEIKARMFFEDNTFKIGTNKGTLKYISLEKVTDLDAPIRKGIDAVYEFSTPPPKYIITEVKMNTKGYKSWKPTLDKTITKSGGSQMTDKWIEFNLRMEFDKRKAMDIIDNGYERILVGVSKENDMILETLDKTAKVTKKTLKVLK